MRLKKTIIMKRIITFIAAVLITATSLMAQSPEKMSYQAVVRNANNDLIKDTQIGMQISILKSSASGTAVYIETQTPTTNTNGLATVEIGGGTVVSGDFSAIDWSAGSYFIKTEIDPAGGTSYTITATSQLLSVPYALYAKTAENVQWQKDNANIYYEDGNVSVLSQPTDINLQVGKIYSNFFSNSFQDIDLSKDRTAYISGLWDANSTAKGVLYLGGNHINPDQVEGSLTFVSGTWENAAIQGREGTNTDCSGELVFLTRHEETSPLTERMRINENGFTGIGTSAPSATLHIRGNSTTEDALKLQINSTSGVGYGQTGIRFQAWRDDASLAAIRAFDIGDWNGDLRFYTDNDNTENENLQERMRLSKDGYLGIGTPNPLYNLHIFNTNSSYIGIESDDNTGLIFKTNRSGADSYLMGIDAGNNKFRIANTTTNGYPFVIHGENIGINTLNPTAPLHIKDFMKLEPRNTAPSNPEEGMVYYDSTDHKLKVYTGSGWENLN